MKLAAACLILVGAASFAAADDACVSCHKGLPEATAAAHSFKEWEKSAHAQAGIKCEDCHGGDASKSSKEKAHVGMLSSRDKNSKVYFTNVPDTCGACHAPEAQAFKKSAHYKELQSSGRGPNCVTCHGSMANRLLSPAEMETTCTLCHHQPEQAFGARTALEDARASLQRLSNSLERARKSGADIASSETSYKALVARFQAMQVDWHTFNTERVRAEGRDIGKQAAAVYTEVARRQKKP